MQAWGKLLIQPGTQVVTDQLSLVNHCVDVASVFRELCNLPSVRRILVVEAGCQLNEIHLDRLAVFALFHDLGKCNRGFQARIDAHGELKSGHVRETAALFSSDADEDLRLKAVAALGLEGMVDWFTNPQEDLLRLLLSAISHHGEPAYRFDGCSPIDIARWHKLWLSHAGYDPFAAMSELGEAARNAFPLAFQRTAAPLQLTLALEHRFAGLLMLADWLGSHREAFFPFHQEGRRIPWGRQQARKALAAVGLDVADSRRTLQGARAGFGDIFAIQGEPKPLQAALDNAGLPPLLIAESDTGSGKTEAALLHFLALFAAGEVDGLYFALPTRVAARELYDRVCRAMRNAFGPSHPPVLLAVPGYVKVDGEPPDLLPTPAQLFHEAAQMQRERAWSAERPKRFLAAPVAVGTIDQALFSVIQVAHAHLRAACLDRSLLVIDEVHSSDVYMRYLSRRLLARHLAAGGRALLLSATLGSSARAEYISPQARLTEAEDFNHAVVQPYPSLCAPGAAMRHLPDPASRSKRVLIQPRDDLFGLEALLPGLRDSMAAGQRVMVVTNTVARAISLSRLADADPDLAPVLFSLNGQRCPHHGRFARADRELLDKEVSRRLGKQSPSGAVLLIGTQTLEQSLDIDADWLISDLCPMDVLLQRIGRLQRHDRGVRPKAVCTVLLPAEEDFSVYLKANGELARGGLAGLGSVYEDLRILQLTRDWAAGRPEIEIPRDNRLLVESTTHPERLASLASPKWQAHGGRLTGAALAQTMAAHHALIPDHHFGEFLFNERLEERLATRLGLNDRVLDLGGAYVSPFGNLIHELNLPGHLARGLASEQAHLVSQVERILDIHVGALHFRYSRFGLEKVDEPAH